MRYVDTCLLVSLFFHDSGTDAVLRWLEEAATDPIMASHWSLTEFSSAASLKARAKQITPDLRRKAMTKLRRFVTARLTLEPPSAADFERATELLEKFDSGLRAGDALHLAICIRHGATLCTADLQFADAAEALNVKLMRVG